ncbi:ImuA family protein [Methylobacterium nigriterrae]|uniref:ImuA family protein n=1 Tax=Methylobacterium nigriterrae TaxID=3127512 RepID=UPI0030137F1A
MPELDAWLGGGLVRGVLHEIYASHVRHPAAATGFALGLALRASDRRPLVWIHQDRVEARVGGLYGDGLAEFGLDPSRLVVVRTRDPTGALRAVDEAARCTGLGAALVEIWGEPRILDLKASQRLTLAARASGVTLLMIRLDASPCPSAAATRWRVATAASIPFEAKAPGRPTFAAALLRHRAGLNPRTWHLEWDRDSLSFSSADTPAAAPLPRPVVSLPVVGPDPAEDDARWRRVG